MMMELSRVFKIERDWNSYPVLLVKLVSMAHLKSGFKIVVDPIIIWSNPQ